MGYMFERVVDGPLWVWKEPEHRVRYTIGIDPSTGLGKDFTVMQVLTNTKPHEQVAKVRAKWNLDMIASYATSLGRWYNNAMLIIETNEAGIAVQEAVLDKYKYRNNYQDTEVADENPQVSSKFGWKTSKPSKWLLVRAMQSAIIGGDIIINCHETVEELMNFVYLEDSTKTGALPGLFDDCVMALMLAYYAACRWPQAIHRPKHQNLHADVAQARSMLERFNEALKQRGQKEMEVMRL
jgi:hypothetical protein